MKKRFTILFIALLVFTSACSEAPSSSNATTPLTNNPSAEDVKVTPSSMTSAAFKSEAYARIKFLIDSSWQNEIEKDGRCLYFPPVTEPTGFFQCQWINNQFKNFSDEVARTSLEGSINGAEKPFKNVEEISRTYFKVGDKNASRVCFYYDMDNNDINNDKRGVIDMVTVCFDDGISSFTALFTDTEYNKTYSQLIKTAIESITLDPQASTSSTKPEATQSITNVDDTAIKALEATLPVENAKRAAVVAITNSMAVDVFKADGNTLDISKFHSYADTTGNVDKYFFKVNSWGDWTAKDNKTWHVDSLELEQNLGCIANLELDVNFDSKNYIISNIKGTYGNSGNTQNFSDMVSETNIAFKVPTKLIKDDRSQASVDALDHSGDLDKHTARNAFANYGKSQYPYGFDCHWLTDLRGEDQYTDGSWFFKVGVTVKNQYGAKVKMIAEGKIGGTTTNPVVTQFDVH